MLVHAASSTRTDNHLLNVESPCLCALQSIMQHIVRNTPCFLVRDTALEKGISGSHTPHKVGDEVELLGADARVALHPHHRVGRMERATAARLAVRLGLLWWCCGCGRVHGEVLVCFGVSYLAHWGPGAVCAKTMVDVASLQRL